MTLSTVDAEGRPDARTLILKDVDRLGWAFASTRSSAKGRQLAMHPGWRVVPEQIEFWQGAADRHPLRLVYERRSVTRRARRVLETYFCC